MAIVFIGIGANLGEPLKQCQSALEELKNIPHTRIIKESSFYKSEPLVFLNCHSRDPTMGAVARGGNPDSTESALDPGLRRDDSKITPWYINAVCQMETSLSPQELLKALISIEEKMGRKRAGKWESRVIDLDILFYDDFILSEENLKIPHPEIPNRRFVLQPFTEITPDFVHPVFQQSISVLLQETTDQLKIEKI